MHESFSRPSKPNVGLIIIRQISISTFLICSSVLINYSLANSISSDTNAFKNSLLINSSSSNSASNQESSSNVTLKREFKRGTIRCEFSSECQVIDPNSLCLMTLIIPNEKRCECAPGFVYHPLTKSCIQLFECSIDSDCKNVRGNKPPNLPTNYGSNGLPIIGNNPVIDEFECINKSCRKKRMIKRFNEFKTWLPLIIPSCLLSIGAVLFLICANRTFPSFRRREARWFAASISSSLKSSRAPSPPPSFEFPPSYSSCFTHSCSNIHSITTYHSLSSNHHLRIINNNQPSPLSIRSNPPPKYTSRAPSRAASRDDISRAPSPARSLADSIELSSSCRSVPKDDVIKA